METIEAKTIVGIAKRIDPTLPEVEREIAAHWENFYQLDIREKILDKKEPDVYAVYCDYAGIFENAYTLVLGCDVKELVQEIPEGMVALLIPPATYERFTAEGEFPRCLIDTWQTIWKKNLNRTYQYDFEMYGPNFYKEPQVVEVYVGINPLSSI